MTFKDFLEHLERSLGYHQIPLNRRADSPRDIFESCPLHDELTKQLVRTIYKRNQCQRFIDPIDRAKTETVLTEIRNSVMQEKATDVDRYHFIEDFCAATNDFFVDTRQSKSIGKTEPGESGTAQVVDLQRYRQKRMRWRA
jgi:cobalamin biosynthesis protein CbiD